MAATRACGVADVPPGRVIGITLEGRRLFLTNMTGRIVAGDGACPHAGCSLAEAAVLDDVLVCTCHGARFDATGAVRLGPARRPLRLYPVEVRDGDVYVDLTTR